MQMAKILSNSAKTIITEVKTSAIKSKFRKNIAVISKQNTKPKVAANFFGAKSTITIFSFKTFKMLTAMIFNRLNLPVPNARTTKSNSKNTIAQ